MGEIYLPGLELSVTASLGIAGYPDHAATPERMERSADAALYVAKRSGRDRTEVAEPLNESTAVDDTASFNGHENELRTIA